MVKILFLHQGLLSFVDKDLKILKNKYEIHEIYVKGLNDIPALWKGVRECDVTFSWFGKIHAFFAVFLSKILGRKSIVVAGGDDVAYEPDIGYGMFSYRWKRWCPLLVFRYADSILSVSEFNRHETIKNGKANPTKVNLIYHGFDSLKFRPIEGVVKEQLVITVGGVDWERLYRKGYEQFVKSAAYLPQNDFALIGRWYDDSIEYLRAIAPPNVTFTGWVNEDQLINWYSRAKLYVQASIHEGFGCSIAEAMLCECIPVVSSCGAIPEVVGDCGFYVDELTSEKVAGKINKALKSDLGKRARERIEHNFSLEKRRNSLLVAVNEVMSK